MNRKNQMPAAMLHPVQKELKAVAVSKNVPKKEK